MNKQQIQNGLIDYLTIMNYAGITDISNLPVKNTIELLENKSPIISVTKNDNTTDINNISTKSDNLQDNKIESDTKELPRESVVSSTLPLHEIENMTKAERLKLLAEEVTNCSQCPELVCSRTQTVFGIGNHDSPLLFLGEAPGADEDIQGEPFVGRSGKLLNDIITKGMKIKREDIYICNILRCRPPNNRPPTPEEAANCKTFLERTIKIVNPKFICCLGTIATKYLLQTDKLIGQMRGKVHDYNGIKVVCTYHPSYLLRLQSAKKDAWEDIQLLMKIMENNT
ncbi:MAG: uracil-DNA glycosylase [Planctomycetaceae bacterium]|jgi:DNA polymerase|nr:uracil-DNA glycosylase [Planctomycetaceae bacterium]